MYVIKVEGEPVPRSLKDSLYNSSTVAMINVNTNNIVNRTSRNLYTNTIRVCLIDCFEISVCVCLYVFAMCMSMLVCLSASVCPIVPIFLL